MVISKMEIPVCRLKFVYFKIKLVQKFKYLRIVLTNDVKYDGKFGSPIE